MSYVINQFPISHRPMDYTVPDVLDLCVRKKCRTPSPAPEGAHQSPRSSEYADPPTTMCFSSPGSHAGSEVSETSLYSEPMSTFSVSPESQLIPKNKIPRPFKAYPKDPLSLAVGVATAEAVLGKDAAGAYVEFRKRMLSQVQNQNQGTNIKMRRTTVPTNGNNDPTYWEKRRKNNEAAKRSRDARRAKEDEIAIRCAFLEQENLKLRYEVAALRNETERLRTMVYN